MLLGTHAPTFFYKKSNVRSEIRTRVLDDVKCEDITYPGTRYFRSYVSYRRTYSVRRGKILIHYYPAEGNP